MVIGRLGVETDQGQNKSALPRNYVVEQFWTCNLMYDKNQAMRIRLKGSRRLDVVKQGRS